MCTGRTRFGSCFSSASSTGNARMLWDAGITYVYGTDTTLLPRDSLAHGLEPL